MDALNTLIVQVRDERGLDLRSYKPTFVARRLAVRLRACDCPDYAAYLQLLRRDPQEYSHLVDAFSINLTHFFRDATTFQAVHDRIIPQLVAARAAERRLRACSAGCAGGEEAYSLAILVREALGPALAAWQIELVGLDLDERALDRARRGVYEPLSFSRTAARYEAWIDRYFSPPPQRQLSAAVRSMVGFRRVDLTRDTVPVEQDLILCRNVLIYFTREQQDRLLGTFYSAVRPGGFLVLGKTEILPSSWTTRFIPVELREHIYRRDEEDR
jgi:chemotaxis methyl-accepting protein methylase